MAGRATEVDVKALEQEVLALCRHGLRNSDPPATPGLRDVLRIPGDLSDAQALPQLRKGIMNAISGLPVEIRDAFLVASGARPGSSTRRNVRLQEAASLEKVSERTIRRNEIEAVPLLVARLLEGEEHAVEASRFTVTHLHLWLDLSLPRPVLSQQRTIKVLAPHMEGFYEEFTIPDLSEGAPVWRDLGGCSVDHVATLGGGMWGVSHSFPHPLWQGDTHTFSTAMRLPDHTSLRPEIRFRPSNTTLDTVVDIRFGDHLPSRIECFETTAVLENVPDKDITHRIVPDASDQRIEFKEIRLGCTAGVRWFMDD